MFEQKHTPGPWIKYGSVIKSGDLKLADVRVPNDEGQANAKLIAAAPELLEALQRLQTAAYNVGGEHVTGHQQLIDAADSAQTAIAKATQ